MKRENWRLFGSIVHRQVRVEAFENGKRAFDDEIRTSLSHNPLSERLSYSHVHDAASKPAVKEKDTESRSPSLSSILAI